MSISASGNKKTYFAQSQTTQSQDNLAPKHQSALNIQRVFRGYVGRQWAADVRTKLSGLTPAEFIRALSECGAELNIPDNDGQTPVFRVAPISYNPAVYRLFRELGADLRSTEA